MIVEGLDRVIISFTKAAVASQGLAVVAVGEVASRIQETAKSLAPVETGALRDSIEADTRGTSAEVGPSVPYAPFVEFGTATTSPQPFMGPATDQHEAELLRAIEAIGVSL